MAKQPYDMAFDDGPFVSRRDSRKLAGGVSHRTIVGKWNPPRQGQWNGGITTDNDHRIPLRCVSEAPHILPETSASGGALLVSQCNSEPVPAGKRSR